MERFVSRPRSSNFERFHKPGNHNDGEAKASCIFSVAHWKTSHFYTHAQDRAFGCSDLPAVSCKGQVVRGLRDLTCIGAPICYHVFCLLLDTIWTVKYGYPLTALHTVDSLYHPFPSSL